MSLEAALTAVIARGQAMFEQRPGAMLAVRATADVVAARLPAGVEIAADNAPGLTVVAGDFDAIDALTRELEAQDIGTTRLKVSHAFHSASMSPPLPRVASALQAAALKAPEVPMYSCVTGARLQVQQATDPQYWAQQVRATVQFRRAVEANCSKPTRCSLKLARPRLRQPCYVSTKRLKANRHPWSRCLARSGKQQIPPDRPAGLWPALVAGRGRSLARQRHRAPNQLAHLSLHG